MRSNVDFDEWLRRELVRYKREQRESFMSRRYGQYPQATCVERDRLIWSVTENKSGFT